MANTKSAKKDIRRSAQRRVKNVAAKSALKTYVKRVRVGIVAVQADQVQPEVQTTAAEALRVAMKALDKAAQNGIIHKNQAARRKSRLAKQLSAAGKPAAVEAPAAA